MALRDEMIALIPDDLNTEEKAEIIKIIEHAIEMEKDTPDRPITPEDLEGLD